MDRFRDCLAHTLAHEGGWYNHPKDPGGPTMRGVIQRVYDGWRTSHGLERRSVREIEEHELQEIYRNQYWRPVQAGRMPLGVDLALFDYAVNSGPAQAARDLQRVVRVNNVDGHVGEATIAAVQAMDPSDVVTGLLARRRKLIRGLKHYATFRNGWERRCNEVEQAALFDAAGDSPAGSRPPAAVERGYAPNSHHPPATAYQYPPEWQELSDGPPALGDDMGTATGKATPAPEPQSMWSSSTARTTEVVGGGGGLTVATKAAEKVQMLQATKPARWAVLDLVLALLADPVFLAGAITLAGATYIWLERARKTA